MIGYIDRRTGRSRHGESDGSPLWGPQLYIPKPDGRQRPLGVAALEDKIVQQALAAILNQIYEEDFMGFSYGFRQGRSQHQALDALSAGIMTKKVNWILDADIKGFLDPAS
jgi:retron-type reverse transcriptase